MWVAPRRNSAAAAVFIAMCIFQERRRAVGRLERQLLHSEVARAGEQADAGESYGQVKGSSLHSKLLYIIRPHPSSEKCHLKRLRKSSLGHNIL